MPYTTKSCVYFIGYTLPEKGVFMTVLLLWASLSQSNWVMQLKTPLPQWIHRVINWMVHWHNLVNKTSLTKQYWRFQIRSAFVVILPITSNVSSLHDDVMKWKHFPRYWPFVWGIHRWPVNSPHKGQWRGALMFSLICAWLNGWVNNRNADVFRRHRAHYDVIVMVTNCIDNRSEIYPAEYRLTYDTNPRESTISTQ